MIHSRYMAPLALAIAFGCSPRRVADRAPQPAIIAHAQWDSQPPVGYAADATRRNRAPGDSLHFRNLTVEVLGTVVDSSGEKPTDVVRLAAAR